MKKNYNPGTLFFIILAVLFMAAATGCVETFDLSNSAIFDDPDQGIMTKQTADKIFNWVSNGNLVTITRFKDAAVLEQYLAGTAGRVAAADPSKFIIATINEKPVTKIDSGAFSPDKGAADISAVVDTLRLSDSVTVINKTAFKGIKDALILEIPRTLLDRLDDETLQDIEENLTIKTIDGDDAGFSPSSDAQTITLADIGGVEAPAIKGIPVKAIQETEQYTGKVSWSDYPAAFEANWSYTAIIRLTPKPGYTLQGVKANFFKVVGAKTSHSADSGVIRASFPKTPLPVGSLEALEEALAGIKEGDILLLDSSFYEKANFGGKPLVFHGADEDNRIPYTIQGLGKEGPPLTVGILLANDNITLRDIRFQIIDSKYGVDNSAISNKYCSAITIARAGGANTPGFLSQDRLPGSNVTVDNCAINFTGTGKPGAKDTLFTGGIFVAEAANGNTILYQPEGVVIKNTSVTVKGYDKQAVQALLIPPTVTVTNNVLTAIGGNGSIYAPASAIFISGVIASSEDQALAPMTGNILTGETFDFWIASPQTASTINNNRNGVGTGPINMAALGFGTGKPDKRWAFNLSDNQDNNYFKLLQSLKSQCNEAGRAGYGRIFIGMLINSVSDGVEEKYEIQGGQITAIDYWGYPLNTTNDGYDTSSKDIYGRIGGNGKYHNNRTTEAGAKAPYN
ncbi:MAG: hypothetical protein LBU19_07050 [Treponema sp.]|jgi:hypothetical protein|nr:hypothetical protein [Treponema sp.]